MSDRIYRAVPLDFIRRMRNWARAVTGQLAATRSNWKIEPGELQPWIEAPIPILEGEAQDTDEVLRLLPERYRWAVEEFWSREGRSLREHARGRQIKHDTFEVWVLKGHDLMRAELVRKSERWHEQAATYAQRHAMSA